MLTIQKQNQALRTGMIALWLLAFPTMCLSQSKWEWASPRPHGNSLHSVAFGHGCFVAVGSAGAIQTSSDGTHWTMIDAGVHASLTSVVYDGNRFVSVGAFGTILTSSDGLDWTVRNSGTSQDLNAVNYGNGLYVAVGDSGTILISEDGATWRAKEIGIPMYLSSVDYGDGLYVASGFNTPSWTSVDGSEWSWTPDSVHMPSFRSLYYGNGAFVGIEMDRIWTSDDGKEWFVSGRTDSGDIWFDFMVFTSGRFLAISNQSIFSSTDGVNWASRKTNLPPGSLSMAYGNDVFVAVGSLGRTASSPDGETWSNSIPTLPGILSGVAFGNDMFVAVGNEEIKGKVFDYVWTSPDGMAWTAVELDLNCKVNSVAFGNGVFVATGKDGLLLTSADGKHCDIQNSNTHFYPNVFKSVIYGNGLFLVMGINEPQRTIQNYAFWSSPDGHTWTIHRGVSRFEIHSIAYGNGMFMAAGNDRSAVLTSSDGKIWTERSSDDGSFFRCVAFASGRFVALRGMDTVLTSSDGVEWKAAKLPRRNNFPGVPGISFMIQTEGQIFALGDGEFMTSRNGEDWVPRDSETSSYLRSATYGKNRYVAVGHNTIVFSNEDGATTLFPFRPVRGRKALAIRALHGRISVSIPDASQGEAFEVMLLNASGRRVFAEKSRVQNGTVDIPNRGLPSGRYFLSAGTGNGRVWASRFDLQK